MTRLTHDEIVTRERGIYDLCVEQSRDPIFAIAKDRAARWDAYRAALVVRDEIVAWETSMAANHGPECRFYNSTVCWVVALLIARYGEAEYHWPEPENGFTDEDVARAKKWFVNGAIPTGCFYL